MASFCEFSKYEKSRNIRFVENLFLSTRYEFYYDLYKKTVQLIEALCMGDIVIRDIKIAFSLFI